MSEGLKEHLFSGGRCQLIHLTSFAIPFPEANAVCSGRSNSFLRANGGGVLWKLFNVWQKLGLAWDVFP